MSDTVLIQGILATSSLFGTAITAYLGFLISRQTLAQTQRAADQKHEDAIRDAELKVAAAKVEATAAVAARKVDSVKTSLEARSDIADQKLDGLASVAKATHTLVNSNMAAQLLLNKTVTQRLADLTMDPSDIRIALDSAQKSDEHAAKQAEVDSQAGSDDEKKGRKVAP